MVDNHLMYTQNYVSLLTEKFYYIHLYLILLLEKYIKEIEKKIIQYFNLNNIRTHRPTVGSIECFVFGKEKNLRASEFKYMVFISENTEAYIVYNNKCYICMVCLSHACAFS